MTRKKRERNLDHDPMIDLPLTKILRETAIGLVVVIGDETVWLPREDCEWTDTTISMPRSIATERGLREPS